MATNSAVRNPAFAAYTRRFTPARKLQLIVEVLVAYARVRRRLADQGVPELAAELRGQAVRSQELTDVLEQQHAGLRLGRVVARVLSALPTDSRCLTQSLVLTDLLARRGIDSTVVIGVSSEPQFAAHAWVESNGIALLPTNAPEYARLTEL